MTGISTLPTCSDAIEDIWSLLHQEWPFIITFVNEDDVRIFQGFRKIVDVQHACVEHADDRHKPRVFAIKELMTNC